MNRTKNVILNFAWGILSKFSTSIFSFASRTVFIYVLGTNYLGINGLYSEILAFLSLAELGFGASMVFLMYKPVAENDIENISQLLEFYKTSYRLIALAILMLGLCIVPFLDNIVKEVEWISINELRIYFLFFLFNTVVGYFIAYRYTYINALQKQYIVTNIDSIVTNISYILQIATLFLFKSFLFYLLINSFVLFCSRIVIVIFLNRKFPIFKKKSKQKLDKKTKSKIFKEVRGMSVHSFSNAAVYSTDNILISSMISQGVNLVGLIANYTLIINSVTGFINILVNSFMSGIGNLIATTDNNKIQNTFNQLYLIFFWIYGFSSIALWLLVPPFINLWIGSDKLIDDLAFILIIVNYYLNGQFIAYSIFRIAKGNFNKDKWVTLLQAVTNLIISVLCAKVLGLVGIYIGTITSRLVVLILNPVITYRFIFNNSPLIYYKKLFRYFMYFIIAAIISKCCVSKILTEITYIRLFFSSITIIITVNLVFFLFTKKTKEFSEIQSKLSVIIAQLLHSKKRLKM